MPKPRGRRTPDSRPLAPHDRGQFALLLICFVLSGFAGLLYETIWTRQFSFVFGTSELAVATVLAAYFGGLAIGAALAGRWAQRTRRPVLAYGLLELGIALSALAVPMAIRGATQIYKGMMASSGLADAGGLGSALFYLAAAFVILIIPTGLMGATLPLLARYAVHDDRQIGPRIGLLYTANTLGAVAGTLFAAFVLLPRIGQSKTVWVGVATNVAVFIAAAILAKRASPRSQPEAAQDRTPAKSLSSRWILPVVCLSGAISLSYEVLWTRLLGHILGGTIYAFATMLASFLLGIAIGSAAAARWASGPERATRGFAWTQLGAAVLSLIAFWLLPWWPALAERLGAGVWSGLSANASLAIAILLPATLCIGASFPFAVRILAHDERDAPRATARVYAWNTVGAILGSIATGFFLLPLFSFSGMLIAAVGLNLLLALCVALHRHHGSKPVLIGALACAALLVIARPAEPWPILQRSALGGLPVTGERIFYAVGRSATVLLMDDGIGWDVRTNGLPEANIRRRGSAPSRVLIQAWQTALPVLARPDARKMLVIGLGGGMVLETAPKSIEQIDVVELEPEVITANRLIGPDRANDPLADPRVHLHVNDARGALVVARDQYDAIVSQPSHPWTAGASNLYTREFFALAKEHLTSDGVFLQWMATNFVDTELIRSLLAALHEVFEYVEVYAPQRGALLFIASAAPFDLRTTATQAISARPDDFHPAGILCVEDVLAAIQLPTGGTHSFVGDAPPITDDLNLLQLKSQRARREADPWAIFGSFTAPADQSLTAQSQIDWAYLVQRVGGMGNAGRAHRLAELCQLPAMRETCVALAQIAEGQAAQAAPILERVVAEQPENDRARYAWVRLRSGDYLRGNPQVAAEAQRAKDPVRAIFDGWHLQVRQDWAAMRGLESRLVSAKATDDWYADAMRLRVLWRLRANDPALAAEAVALSDEFLPRFGAAEDYIRRAEASLIMGDQASALSALVEVMPDLRKTPQGRALATRVQRMMESIGELSQAAAATRLRSRASQVIR